MDENGKMKEVKATRNNIWNEFHHRLKSSIEIAEKGFELTPDAKKEILKQRAKLLAHESSGLDTGNIMEVVEFSLADEIYAIPSKQVREVYSVKCITPVPCTPRFVLGIINVRGQILSVIDLKEFFGLPQNGVTESTKVIIIGTGDMEVGILADMIAENRNIPVSEIQPSLPTLAGIRAEYLIGVTNERLAILDAHKILSDRNIIVNEEV